MYNNKPQTVSKLRKQITKQLDDKFYRKLTFYFYNTTFNFFLISVKILDTAEAEILQDLDRNAYVHCFTIVLLLCCVLCLYDAHSKVTLLCRIPDIGQALLDTIM